MKGQRIVLIIEKNFFKSFNKEVFFFCLDLLLRIANEKLEGSKNL